MKKTVEELEKQVEDLTLQYQQLNNAFLILKSNLEQGNYPSCGVVRNPNIVNGCHEQSPFLADVVFTPMDEGAIVVSTSIPTKTQPER